MLTRKRTGILLTNLGTPCAPTAAAVKRYLREFLSDTRIVALPRWLWWPILTMVVLPWRSRSSAKLYQKIWLAQGSPLLYFSQLQAQALQAKLAELPGPVTVALGMRYGQPSLAEGLQQLRSAGVDQLIILPMYPQYSQATVGSTIDKVASILKTWCYIPQFHVINQYADHPGYIDALVGQTQAHWAQQPRAEKLLFSFHGLPRRSIDQGDPYYHLCHKTAQLVADKLGCEKEHWQVVFQSRFGKQQWLTPYCDVVLKELAVQGVQTVDIICPGFAADCLETLEEILHRYKTVFLTAGGKQLNYIPALNAAPTHIAALADLVLPFI